MNKSLVIVFFAIVLKPCFAQVLPVANPPDALRKNHVKSISVFYTIPETGNKECIYKRTFNASGQCLQEFSLALWTDVTHSRVTTFQYNRDGLLVEEMLTDQILEYFPRDRDYIEEFGDKPLYQKTSYEYNAAGLLAVKRIFVASSSPDFSEDSQPAQVITYEWKDKLLLSEKSESPLQNGFTRIYQISYQYDEQGKLTGKSMMHGTDLARRQTTIRYDSLGQQSEEIIADLAMPRNNAHFKYAYDSAGRLAATYKYSQEVGTFEEVAVYAYDNYGNAIAGERGVLFTYYNNGLIKTERWTDELTDVEILLSTEYEYF